MSSEVNVSPKSNSQRDQISIRISTQIRDIAEELADLQGEPVSEIYRMALKIGLSALVEQDNKFRVHDKLMRRAKNEGETVSDDE
jgi:DNA-binding protein Fis